jgi:hypothetical protein
MERTAKGDTGGFPSLLHFQFRTLDSLALLETLFHLLQRCEQAVYFRKGCCFFRGLLPKTLHILLEFILNSLMGVRHPVGLEQGYDAALREKVQ